MAKRRRRSNRNFVAIPFTKDLALLTLGNGSVLKIALTEALSEDLYVVSTDISAVVRGLTAGEGEPMFVGLSHGDYSVTEIQENLQVALTGPGTKIEQERSRRLVRRSGPMQTFDDNNTKIHLRGRGGSALVRTKCKFVVQNPLTLDVWVQNRSGSTLTTGSVLTVDGTIYGRWIL